MIINLRWKHLKSNFLKLFLILSKMFYYFWVKLHDFIFELYTHHKSTLKFSMMKTNHETQFKIYIHFFPIIAHNASVIFCMILYMKNAIVHLKKRINSVHLVQYLFVKIHFKNFRNDWKTFVWTCMQNMYHT